MKPVRPDFARPPLVEQAITVIFEPLSDFSIGDFGLFWAAIRHEFPRTEVKEPIEAKIEDFDGAFRPAEFQVRFIQAGFLQRCFYWSAAGDEVIQLQADRFTFNWHGDGATYPRSEATKARFDELFSKFEAFVSSRGLGPITVRQCELLNVNIVPATDCGSGLGDAPTLFNVGTSPAPIDFLPVESYVSVRQHTIVDDGLPVGRLYSALSPVVRVDDQQRAYKLEITARGIFPSGDTDRFFDLARSAINAAFLGMTTEAAHQHWGLKNG